MVKKDKILSVGFSGAEYEVSCSEFFFAALPRSEQRMLARLGRSTRLYFIRESFSF
jgi:hypothetical protein